MQLTYVTCKSSQEVPSCEQCFILLLSVDWLATKILGADWSDCEIHQSDEQGSPHSMGYAQSQPAVVMLKHIGTPPSPPPPPQPHAHFGGRGWGGGAPIWTPALCLFVSKKHNCADLAKCMNYIYAINFHLFQSISQSNTPTLVSFNYVLFYQWCIIYNT